MNRRQNFLWLAGGMLIGSAELMAVATLLTAGGTAGYAQTAQSHKPNNMLRAVAARRVFAAGRQGSCR